MENCILRIVFHNLASKKNPKIARQGFPRRATIDVIFTFFFRKTGIIPSIFFGGQKYAENRILGIVFHSLGSKNLRNSTIKTYILQTTVIIQSWFRPTTLAHLQ